METDTVHLYRIHGVPKAASPDAIRKAYRRLALRYHPDKVNPIEVPDHQTRFQEISTAYQVLGDPKKRRLYDKYGMSGVKMAESGVGSMLLNMERTLCNTAITLTLVFTLTIVFLILLSRRVDGKADWNYFTVFTPIWILDLLIVYTIFQMDAQKAKDDEEASNALDEESEGQEPMTADQREDRRRQQIKRCKQDRSHVKFLRLTGVTLLTAFQVLIAMKANDPTNVMTVLVFVPYYIYECFDFTFTTVRRALLFRMIPQASELPFFKVLDYIFDGFWRRMIFIAFTVLVTLRIDHTIDCSWAIVFIPLYLPGLWYLKKLLQVTGSICCSPIENSAVRSAHGLACAINVGFWTVATPLYTLIGLLVARLGGHKFSLYQVLLPVYIILSILLCCSGCCMPCVIFGLRGDTNRDWTPENDTEGPRVRLVPSEGSSSTYGATGSSSRTGQSSNV
ncbi:MAG: hypothetical protein J3Q66DRAFT_434964 [Benniella sp.]|nr:MAG: hypothetical protein J3Q66DRAFT_434964 [Benniella sp.]